MFPLDPSDLVLLLDFMLAVVFALVFALGRPRTWYADPLGWVILYFALSVVLLLFLIGWAIVLGQRLDEIFRLLIALALGTALVWKTVAVIRERHHGRLARARPNSHERHDIMSTPLDSTAPLRIGETVSSASPKVDLGPAKAVVATIATAVSMALGALAVALADEVVTTGEWVTIAIAFLAGTGLVGGATYAARTSVTRNS